MRHDGLTSEETTREVFPPLDGLLEPVPELGRLYVVGLEPRMQHSRP